MIIHQNLLVARGAADEKEEDGEEEGEETKGHKMKKQVPPYFLKILSTITNREIIRRGVEFVIADWRYHHQDAFADWFESVYFCDAWDNGVFFD
jgi:hypothetical protein